MNNPKEKASYCLGLEAGRSLKEQFMEIDVNFLKEGFEDALSGSQPKLSQEEVMNVMNALKQQIGKQQREFYIQMAARNKTEGEEFLSANGKKEGIISMQSGLQYKVLKSGLDGQKPTGIDTVTAHIRGYFLDGKVFENTYEREQPHVFPVNRIIPGWAEALHQMNVGDKWQLFIPPYLAYGEMGLGNEIGPNMTLIFEIELVKIN